ncbi:MAG TPA: di-heme oxidoredictase family protein, partial [Opitutaceae bacterium]|nr:di-heme oxidoredictase family protein [Opitutaceae bacterium]
MKTSTLLGKLTAPSLAAGLGFLTIANVVHASATDPGVRGGSANAGAMLSGLTTDQNNAFVIGQATFNEIDSVSGTVSGETGKGLGPGFNSNSCASCHAYPAMGGSSPFNNPQIRIATLDGAQNSIPSFITATGPVREARFVLNPDGTPDGGVHDLFVITGRSDAPSGFNLPQTNFATQVTAGNVIFRIPTPTFGLGLIEAIPDAAILANQAANASAKAKADIIGVPNRSGNDGTITRFGWKAQNKSLLMFSGEA